jgi:putative transposase
VRCLKMPRWSPNLNSFSESFVRTARRECLDRIILLGEKHVRFVISSFEEHYNTERPHKGLDYRRPVERDEEPPSLDAPVKCHERLGGLLRSYYREAA